MAEEDVVKLQAMSNRRIRANGRWESFLVLLYCLAAASNANANMFCVGKVSNLAVDSGDNVQRPSGERSPRSFSAHRRCVCVSLQQG